MALNTSCGQFGQKKSSVLVEKHPVFRQGLTHVINQQADVAVCGEADNAEAGFALVADLKPDLAVVDVTLAKSCGLELVKNLKHHHPSVPVLVLSMHEEVLYTERALRAGARGYIMKNEPIEAILLAIRRVLNGRIHLSPDMGTRLLNPLVNGLHDLGSSPIDSLSDRELEVFQLLGKGTETRQIADALCLSVKTVESYREHIKAKLNLDNSPQLIRKAVEWALAARLG